MSKKTLISHLRNIPDYPMKGVQFKDVTSWFMNPEDMNEIVDSLYEMYKNKGITKVCGIESRGFIVGAALAYRLDAGFIPIRKPGKLPYEKVSIEYKKEYGVVCRFIHVRGYYNSADLFVVPAINDQVVSFSVPDVFNRDDYDRAMKFVIFLNELTEQYGKTKVQKKGGLPKEASDALQSVLDELKLSRMWNTSFS